jgi:hypothetical protein
MDEREYSSGADMSSLASLASAALPAPGVVMAASSTPQTTQYVQAHQGVPTPAAVQGATAPMQYAGGYMQVAAPPTYMQWQHPGAPAVMPHGLPPGTLMAQIPGAVVGGHMTGGVPAGTIVGPGGVLYAASPHPHMGYSVQPMMPRRGEREDSSGRWILEPEDVLLLERVFALEKCPGRELRSQLAARLHVKPRQIQVWFQNKRQRTKTGAKPTAAEVLAKAVYSTGSDAEVGAGPSSPPPVAEDSGSAQTSASTTAAVATDPAAIDGSNPTDSATAASAEPQTCALVNGTVEPSTAFDPQTTSSAAPAAAAEGGVALDAVPPPAAVPPALDPQNAPELCASAMLALSAGSVGSRGTGGVHPALAQADAALAADAAQRAHLLGSKAVPHAAMYATHAHMR